MSLKTRFGNLGNILDEDESQADVLQLESPVLLDRRVRRRMRAISAQRAARDRLHLRRRRRRPTRCATRSSASAPRPRRRCAAAATDADPDRRACRRRTASPIADDPRDRRGAHAPRAPGPAHLHLAQRALGRVPRHALLRGADRRRRDRRSTPIWPRTRSPTATRRGLFGELDARRLPDALSARRSTRACSRSCRKMGISVISLLSRRLQFRGGRPVARAGRRILPGHASRASPASASPASSSRSRELHARACDADAMRAADRRLLPATAAAARPTPGRRELIHTAADARSRPTATTTYQAATREAMRRRCRRSRSARPARLQRASGEPMPLDEVESDHRDPQALRHARHVAGRARRPRRTRRSTSP